MDIVRDGVGEPLIQDVSQKVRFNNESQIYGGLTHHPGPIRHVGPSFSFHPNGLISPGFSLGFCLPDFFVGQSACGGV